MRIVTITHFELLFFFFLPQGPMLTKSEIFLSYIEDAYGQK